MSDPRELDPLEMSESLRNPQLEPADHCWVVLVDFGPTAGGWAPGSIQLPWLATPAPFVYTGNDLLALEAVRSVCRKTTQETGRPTRLVRFSQREDISVFGGSS